MVSCFHEPIDNAFVCHNLIYCVRIWCVSQIVYTVILIVCLNVESKLRLDFNIIGFQFHTINNNQRTKLKTHYYILVDTCENNAFQLMQKKNECADQQTQYHHTKYMYIAAAANGQSKCVF